MQPDEDGDKHFMKVFSSLLKISNSKRVLSVMEPAGEKKRLIQQSRC